MTTETKLSEGKLEQPLGTKSRSRCRWFVRAFLVGLQICAIALTVFLLRESNPLLLALVSVATAFPPMMNSLLLGLASRTTRVIATAFILVMMLALILKMSATVAEVSKLWEWLIAAANSVLGIALIAIPEPDQGTELFSPRARKILGAIIIAVVLFLLIAAIGPNFICAT